MVLSGWDGLGLLGEDCSLGRVGGMVGVDGVYALLS
jgi:hypothetical protein